MYSTANTPIEYTIMTDPQKVKIIPMTSTSLRPTNDAKIAAGPALVIAPRNRRSFNIFDWYFSMSVEHHVHSKHIPIVNEHEATK